MYFDITVYAASLFEGYELCQVVKHLHLGHNSHKVICQQGCPISFQFSESLGMVLAGSHNTLFSGRQACLT